MFIDLVKARPPGAGGGVVVVVVVNSYVIFDACYDTSTRCAGAREAASLCRLPQVLTIFMCVKVSSHFGLALKSLPYIV